jgi:hypothetical protein
MFNPIKNGTKEMVYGYECNLPPVGYGVNVVTGKLEKIGVVTSSPIRKKQIWKKAELPKDWDAKRRVENIKIKKDPDYYDPELEEFIVQQWKYRLCGYWFVCNGKPTYITGLHHFYATWWKLDGMYPDYRETDRKYFYVLEYCVNDPACGGLIYATNRRAGKTFKGTVFLYEYTSRTNDAYSGIQSKTGADAKAVFANKLINSFYNLPDFFRPVFDTGKSIRPSSELRFQHQNKKGAKALEEFGRVELNSWLDWKSAEAFSYDGSKLHRYLGDEVGKSIDVNVYDRHQVVKYCLTQAGKWIGFALYTSTVEAMTSGGDNFKKLWDDSNREELDKNGHTKTGLYRLFIPAYDATSFDRFGMPNVEQDRLFFMNRRAAITGNTLSSEIRKNPFDEIEMFRIDGDKCLFDADKLNKRRDYLSYNKEIVVRGNFEWEKGVRDTRVVWSEAANGRWEMPRGFSFENKSDTNCVVKRGNLYYPGNKLRFVTAVDPYDHDMTEDNRASKAGCFTMQKHNPFTPDSPFVRAFICKYHARPPMASMMYEDILMQCAYFGSPMLFESNKIGIKRYFENRKYGEFLIQLPGYKEPGMPSTAPNKQTLAELTEEYIASDIDRVYFIDLIGQWLEFDLMKTQKYDLAMGAGWTLVANMAYLVRHEVAEMRDISNYLRIYKVS